METPHVATKHGLRSPTSRVKNNSKNSLPMNKNAKNAHARNATRRGRIPRKLMRGKHLTARKLNSKVYVLSKWIRRNQIRPIFQAWGIRNIHKHAQTEPKQKKPYYTKSCDRTKRRIHSDGPRKTPRNKPKNYNNYVPRRAPGKQHIEIQLELRKRNMRAVRKRLCEPKTKRQRGHQRAPR